MTLKNQNIAIIGCGPGGLASALFLERLGHNVTLYERFSKPKPVGSGLLIQPSGQRVLRSLDLLETIKSLSYPVDKLHGLSVPKNRRALDMQYANNGDGVPALGIHRASLFDVLMEAVRAKDISIIVDSKLCSVEETDQAIRPVFAQPQLTQSYDFLIDASGAYSPLAMGKSRKLGFGAFWTTVDMPAKHNVLPNALDQRYFYASKMAGIMPVGVNPATGNQGAAVFWSEKPENVERVKRAGIDSFRAEFCGLWPEAEPFVAQIESMDDLTMAIYAHRTDRSNSRRRVFHVGDSWHCTSPQLGQGANMALMDAAALADVIAGAATLESIAHRYRRARSFPIELYQMLSRVFTPLYQSDNRFLPLVRDLTIHHFARLPLIRGLIARTVSGEMGASVATEAKG